MTATAARRPETSSTERTHGPQRRDIQGLRAVAVLLVMIYHLWPTRLSGGFVGVDVFFVISGYLVGGALIAELASTGRIALVSFWKRRARRLLPAALLTLALVAAAVVLLAPSSVHPSALRQAVASALYFQNWALIGDAVDYSTADQAASPVQHYWSLSVEEQLYVALPLVLIVLGLALSRLRTEHRRTITIGVVAGLTLASFGWSVISTTRAPDIAYFSTLTRAWEFLVGALAATVAARLGRRSSQAAAALGIVVIVACAFTLDDGSAFPGYLAAAPVAGALALLLAHDAGPLAWASRWRLVTWTGDISYALYLWHWPLIILAPYVTGHDLRTLDKLLIAVLAIGLAAASTVALENPIRFSPRLLGGNRRARTVFAWCGVATLLVAGGAKAGAVRADGEQARQLAESRVRLEQADLRCLGAAELDPTVRECAYGGELIPTPYAAPLDVYNRTECFAPFGVSEFRACGVGSNSADAPQVLAIGDSHSHSLLIAYEQMGDLLGWHIDVAGRAGCSFGTRPESARSQTYAAECWQWKQNAESYLAEHDPYDLIITTSDQNAPYAVPNEDETPGEATVASFAEAFDAQTRRGTEVVAIRDHPEARGDVITCVEEHGQDSDRFCSRPRDEAIRSFDPLRRAVLDTAGTALADLRDLFCTKERCLTVIGDVVVYRNRNHLTSTYVSTLAPYLAERTQAAWDEAKADTGA